MKGNYYCYFGNTTPVVRLRNYPGMYFLVGIRGYNHVVLTQEKGAGKNASVEWYEFNTITGSLVRIGEGWTKTDYTVSPPREVKRTDLFKESLGEYSELPDDVYDSWFIAVLQSALAASLTGSEMFQSLKLNLPNNLKYKCELNYRGFYIFTTDLNGRKTIQSIVHFLEMVTTLRRQGSASSRVITS